MERVIFSPWKYPKFVSAQTALPTWEDHFLAEGFKTFVLEAGYPSLYYSLSPEEYTLFILRYS